MRVFHNGSKRDEVTGEWRKLHNEELHYLHSSPSIVREIKTRRTRWAGHVACTEERRGEERYIEGFFGETQGKETTWETQA